MNSKRHGQKCQLLATVPTLALSLSAALAYAGTKPTPAEATRRYVETEMRAQNIPGVSVAVFKHGRPIYVQSFGVATLEHAARSKMGCRNRAGLEIGLDAFAGLGHGARFRRTRFNAYRWCT